MSSLLSRFPRVSTHGCSLNCLKHVGFRDYLWVEVLVVSVSLQTLLAYPAGAACLFNFVSYTEPPFLLSVKVSISSLSQGSLPDRNIASDSAVCGK